MKHLSHMESDIVQSSGKNIDSRDVQEHSFVSHDGLNIFYRYWPAQNENPQGAVLLFHRGHEHSGRIAHLVQELNMPEFAFFAWDARAHGLTKIAGQSHYSFMDSVRDVHSFVQMINKEYDFPNEKISLIAQSVGAAQVATWLHDYAPRIRAATLAAPAFDIKLYIPFAYPMLKLAHRVRGDFNVTSYVRPHHLTGDYDRQESYKSDALISDNIPVNVLNEMKDTSSRVVQDARAILTPIQLLIAGRDFVVQADSIHRFYGNLSSPLKERHIFKNARHDLLGDIYRAQTIKETRRFILERFKEPLDYASLLNAHQSGFTKDEFDRLETPLNPFSLKGIYWKSARKFISIGSCISKGLEIGVDTGFDSGSSLDYVYRNTPEGVTPIGKIIDQLYLNSIGWRGIRKRKVHIEALLEKAMQSLKDKKIPLHLLDVAAGHGRYDLDAIDASSFKPEKVLLRDFSELNVESGLRLIAEKGLSSCVHFEKGDAFDDKDLAEKGSGSTIGVVSGLYELFPDNKLVSRSLKGLSQALIEGGYLIYTGQPWHPQLEMIARGLTSHRDGKDWIMRRRTQAEMDQLVEAAGFKKIDQRIDDWGIFTVSLAEKVSKS